MSDRELADSICKEFEDAHNMAELDEYDRALSEVFNCSEENIDIEQRANDISNASVYDGATAAAEAAIMAKRISKKNKILALNSINPEYLKVIKIFLTELI